MTEPTTNIKYLRIGQGPRCLRIAGYQITTQSSPRQRGVTDASVLDHISGSLTHMHWLHDKKPDIVFFPEYTFAIADSNIMHRMKELSAATNITLGYGFGFCTRAKGDKENIYCVVSPDGQANEYLKRNLAYPRVRDLSPGYFQINLHDFSLVFSICKDIFDPTVQDNLSRLRRIDCYVIPVHILLLEKFDEYPEGLKRIIKNGNLLFINSAGISDPMEENKPFGGASSFHHQSASEAQVIALDQGEGLLVVDLYKG